MYYLKRRRDRMELVIVQQNVCGRNLFEGKWSISDYEDLIKRIKEKNPDIIFLTEFYYQQMYNVTHKLFGDYEFIEPVLMTANDKNNNKLYASCVLAIKRNKVAVDKQFKLTNMLNFRYICVDLNIDDTEILKTLFMYVPQTCNSPEIRKKSMLESACDYVSSNPDAYLFVGGDMNSDIDGETTTCIDEFKQIYKKMIDTDYKKHPTWNGKRLDYALISKTLERDYHYNTKPIKTTSDHLGLRTEIFKEEFICPKCGKTYPINGYSIPDMCDECRKG